jgi:hypothetical protein
MVTDDQLERWVDALDVLRAHKAELKEPYLSLVEAWEKLIEPEKAQVALVANQ